MAKSPAWQRSEGKNPEGGLNAKGRAAYNRANPGKPGLKRPQPEGGPRRDSFCARMKGMKKKLTSSKTASDPDSRINKSLRAWNCAEGGIVKKYAKGGGISTAMGRGKSVDVRMAQIDKYLKDPDLEMVMGPNGKFQFRERRQPMSAPSRPMSAPSSPKNANAVPGSRSGDRTPRGGGMKALETASERRARGNNLPGSRSGDRTPRGGGMKALTLSAFGPKAERRGARPLDEPTKVKAPKVKGKDDYSSPRAKRNMGIAKAALEVAGVGRGAMMGKALLEKGIDKALSTAAKKNLLTQRRMSSTIARTRPGEVVPPSSVTAPRYKSDRANRLRDTPPRLSEEAEEDLMWGAITNREAVAKTLGLKIGGVVKNRKQAVAIALSEGRKAARRK